jgi:hypothetical protein
MMIKRTSIISGEENTLELDITEEQLSRFKSGEGYVQDIFPNLTPGEREFLMTGITEAEWDKHLKVE